VPEESVEVTGVGGGRDDGGRYYGIDWAFV
jgi:hypothetical protein